MYLIEPAYQHYVWGGDRISSLFGRGLPPGRYAESWEVSDRKEGMSLINGKTFQEIVQSGVLGEVWDQFPLLIKMIDAKENLSVQIHPDEEAAVRLGGEPKTEMWIALEKSTVYAGLQAGVTQKDFLMALERGSLESLLRKFTLEKGEAIFIPAGLVHAICGDSLLLEVQQNSNTTYRLYDWGRVGRALHLEEGLSCVHWGIEEPVIISATAESIVSNAFFHVARYFVTSSLQLSGCKILFCAKGDANVGDLSIRAGQTCLIPKGSCVTLKGDSELIVVQLSS